MYPSDSDRDAELSMSRWGRRLPFPSVAPIPEVFSYPSARSATLKWIKQFLQPFFDAGSLSREAFIAISRMTLQWAVSTFHLETGGAVPEEELRLFLEMQLAEMGLLTGGGKRKYERSPQGQLRSKSPLTTRLGNTSRVSHSQSSPAAAASSLVASANHAKVLLEKYFTMGEETMTTSLRDSGSQPYDAESTRPMTCSRGPLDPETEQRLRIIRERRNLQRLQQQQQHQQRDSTTPAPLGETEAAAALNQPFPILPQQQAIPPQNNNDRHQQLDSDMIERQLHQYQLVNLESMRLLLLSIEQRQAVVTGEHMERQLLWAQEMEDRSVAADSYSRSFHRALHLERLRCCDVELQQRRGIENEEEATRDGVLFEREDAGRAIEDREKREAETKRQDEEVRRMAREAAQAEIARQREASADSAASEPPPPPDSPRPIHQFVDDAPPEAHESQTNISEKQLQLLQQLQYAVSRLPRGAKADALNERIHALLTKMKPLPLDGSHLQVQRPSTPAVRSVATPTRFRQKPVEDTSGLEDTGGVRGAYRKHVFGKEHHVATLSSPAPGRGGTKSPNRALTPKQRTPQPTAKRGPVDRSMKSPRSSRPPQREEIVEFLRVLLQPAYDSGKLPREMFVDIVRLLSKRIYASDDDSLASSPNSRGVGGGLYQWQQGIVKDLCDLFGPEASVFLPVPFRTQASAD